MLDLGSEDAASSMIVAGELLRRESVLTWNRYWFVEHGNRVSVWQLGLGAGLEYRAVHIGSYPTLPEAVRAAQQDRGADS